jgi:hypothetical protein
MPCPAPVIKAFFPINEPIFSPKIEYLKTFSGKGTRNEDFLFPIKRMKIYYMVLSFDTVS